MKRDGGTVKRRLWNLEQQQLRQKLALHMLYTKWHLSFARTLCLSLCVFCVCLSQCVFVVCDVCILTLILCCLCMCAPSPSLCCPPLFYFVRLLSVSISVCSYLYSILCGNNHSFCVLKALLFNFQVINFFMMRRKLKTFCHILLCL